MSASLSEWVERLGNAPLPAMPFTLQRVPVLLDRENTTHAVFERVIGRDPGFALALFRALGKQSDELEGTISSLAHAVSMLGVEAVTHTRKNLPVLEPPSKKHHTAPLHECYSRAAHAAVYGLELGRGSHDEKPEQIAIAALLNSCSEMALWTQVPDEMEKIHHQIERGLTRENAALAVLGITFDQLSLGLAEHWKLPPLITHALSPSGAFEGRPLGVMLASALARETAHGWFSKDLSELLELIADYQQITPDQATGRCHSWAAEAARNLHDLNMPLSVYSLMSPLTADAESKKTALATPPKAADKPAQPATAPTKSEPTRQKPVASVPAPEKARGTEASKASSEIDSKQLQEEVINTFKAMRKVIAVKHAMFARLSPDGKALKVKFVIGAEKTAPIRQFEVDLQKKGLFSLLMQRSQGIWLREANRDKYLPLIPEALQPALEMGGFFAVSIFAHHKPLGLIYIDAAEPETLTADQYEQFKQLGQALGAAIGKG